ncbi:hypothetical protein TOI97_06950 [Denitrificimonas sp. JX-1]|uniref:Nudix hydrolase domain-containing protein n=1 Tax=Denitrificimonas halotolerans TaxID=3098930 RepID=A0ABU5GS14_9GAMM|nr:hypothetical protein [Denitrificimonas sp. JX-1]MDY7219302.1 hypothetical protein [Denitrificimonas sp. JX-1]
MSKIIRVPRPAATLILTRDCASGIEVYLMQRTPQAVFMPGYYVFPGGAVDPLDSCASMQALCSGVSDAEVSRMLGIQRGGLAYMIAAIRESFEEVGLLLAHDANGDYVEIAQPSDVEYYAGLREHLNNGQLTLADVFRSRGLNAAVERLAFFSHWITPEGLPRRYDTRFFVAAAPLQQTPVPDGQEAVDHIWINPAEALARGERGELALSLPTRSTLQELSLFNTTQSLLEHTRYARQVQIKQ